MQHHFLQPRPLGEGNGENTPSMLRRAPALKPRQTQSIAASQSATIGSRSFWHFSLEKTMFSSCVSPGHEVWSLHFTMRIPGFLDETPARTLSQSIITSFSCSRLLPRRVHPPHYHPLVPDSRIPTISLCDHHHPILPHSSPSLPPPPFHYPDNRLTSYFTHTTVLPCHLSCYSP